MYFNTQKGGTAQQRHLEEENAKASSLRGPWLTVVRARVSQSVRTCLNHPAATTHVSDKEAEAANASKLEGPPCYLYLQASKLLKFQQNFM